MNMLTISCPSCNFCRQVATEKVPDGKQRVTCPQCKQIFAYTKPVSPAPVNAVTPPPAEPATSSPQLPPSIPPARPQLNTDSAIPSAKPRPRPRPAPPRTLMDIGALFNESWKLFQRRFATLIGLYLLTILAFVLPLAVTAGLAVLAGIVKGGVLLIMAAVIGGVAAFYLGFRCFGGFLCAVVDDRLNIGDAFMQGGKVVFPLMWVGCLTGFVICGGFLLLIIPGIIFTVWFFFSQFILIYEDIHGMGALLKSREYVKGEWFNIALRLLLVWTASVLLGMIPLAGPILSIVFLPYVILFHYRLYCDLRELKGDIPYSCGTTDLVKWPAVALAGYILIPALVLTLIGGTALPKLRQLPLKELTGGKAAPMSLSAPADTSGYRIINFPPKEGQSPSANAGDNSPPLQTVNNLQPTSVVTEKGPENIHFFIYAVNYSGEVKVNGTTAKQMEGKPDMQYNYNLGESGFKYGENRIDVDYSEVPSHSSSLLEVHLRISRNTPGKAREILGEWRMKENGSGSKSYTFDIPR